MGVDHMTAVQMAEHILKEYRTLDCTCCNKFFGYMHRQTGAIYCSSVCLSSGSPTASVGHSVMPPTTPLTPKQILAVTNHVGVAENGLEDHQPKPFSLTKVASRQPPKEMDKEKNPFSKKENVEVKTPSLPNSSEKEGNTINKKQNVASASVPPVEAKKSRLPDTSEKEKNPFNKNENAPAPATPVEVKKTGLPDTSEKEKNPFNKKENAPTPAPPVEVKKTKTRLPDASEKDKNPFNKSENAPTPAPPVEVKKTKTRLPDASEKDKNPFNKSENDPTPAPPVEVKKTKKSLPDTSEKEQNPFNKKVATPAPPVEAKKTIREIIVKPNDVVVKLRSALPWSTDPDTSMGQILHGGKCNDDGPHNFYFQSTAMFNKLATLQGDITAFSANGVAVPLKNLELGQLVFAPFSGDLFRGEIIGIPKADVATVFFVDYGNSLDIPRKELSVLPTEFHDIPRLCFQCQWDYWISKDPDEPIIEDISERYHSTETEGITPLLKIGDGQYLIAIGPKIKDVKFTPGEFFVFDKVPLVPSKEVKPVPAKVNDLPETRGRGRDVTDGPRGAIPRGERPTPPFKPAVQKRKKYNFKDCKYSDKLQDGNHIKIGYVWNLIKYLVLSPDDEDKVLALQVLVNKRIDDTKQFKVRPDINEVVLASYQEEYYRAKVLAHEESDMVQVMFFDFGDTTSVKYNELREPTDEIMEIPLYSMNIQLEGVPEPQGEVTLSDEANDLLASLLQLQINKKPEGDSDVHFVTLWNGDNTLNAVIKRLINPRVQDEILEDDPEFCFIDELLKHDAYIQSLVKYYQIKQTNQVMREGYIWNHYDTQFDYFLDDLSIMPLKGIIDVKVIHFRRLDKITVLPIGGMYDKIRGYLSEEIYDFVRDARLAHPIDIRDGQVCLVRFPVWSEYEEIMTDIWGSKKFKEMTHRREDFSDKHAGRWHRAIRKKCVYPSADNDYYLFDFFDLGRTTPVPLNFIYKAPLRFILPPMMSITMVVCWDVTQMTLRLQVALESVLTRGVDLQVKIVAECSDIIICRLIKPLEYELIKEGLARIEEMENKYIEERNRVLHLRNNERVRSQASQFTNPVRYKKILEEPTAPRSMRVNTYATPGLVPEKYVVNLGPSDESEIENWEEEWLKRLRNDLSLGEKYYK